MTKPGDAIDFEEKIRAVDWSEVETAYGAANNVPDLLRRLLADDEKDALKASHDLWCGLCHQHAYVSSASLPALPILAGALQQSSDSLKIEILDILAGFEICTRPDFPGSADTWHSELRSQLRTLEGDFRECANSSDESVRVFARDILAGLGGS